MSTSPFSNSTHVGRWFSMCHRVLLWLFKCILNYAIAFCPFQIELLKMPEGFEWNGSISSESKRNDLILIMPSIVTKCCFFLLIVLVFGRIDEVIRDWVWGGDEIKHCGFLRKTVMLAVIARAHLLRALVSLELGAEAPPTSERQSQFGISIFHDDAKSIPELAIYSRPSTSHLEFQAIIGAVCNQRLGAKQI